MSRGTGLYGTGRKVAEMKATHQVWADAQPVTERCAFCRWTYVGSAEHGRAKATAHRLEKHPEVRPRRLRRGNLQRFNLGDPVHREEGNAAAADVAAMHRRRSA